MHRHAIHLTEHRVVRPTSHLEESEPILPPHWTEETDEAYGVGFDLLGCDQNDIHFCLNKEQRHLTVTARLEGADSNVEFIWTFLLPTLADLDRARVTSRNGVYYLSLPRQNPEVTAHTGR